MACSEWYRPQRSVFGKRRRVLEKIFSADSEGLSVQVAGDHESAWEESLKVFHCLASRSQRGEALVCKPLVVRLASATCFKSQDAKGGLCGGIE